MKKNFTISMVLFFLVGVVCASAQTVEVKRGLFRTSVHVSPTPPAINVQPSSVEVKPEIKVEPTPLSPQINVQSVSAEKAEIKKLDISQVKVPATKVDVSITGSKELAEASGNLRDAVNKLADAATSTTAAKIEASTKSLSVANSSIDTAAKTDKWQEVEASGKTADGQDFWFKARPQSAWHTYLGPVALIFLGLALAAGLIGATMALAGGSIGYAAFMSRRPQVIVPPVINQEPDLNIIVLDRDGQVHRPDRHDGWGRRDDRGYRDFGRDRGRFRGPRPPRPPRRDRQEREQAPPAPAQNQPTT